MRCIELLGKPAILLLYELQIKLNKENVKALA